jgi:biotin carboxylase
LGEFFLKAYDSHQHYFVETIDYNESHGLDGLVSSLQSLPFQIASVFAGSEPGVELAERLSEALHLATANGTELLHARKDKAEMQEQLRRSGVPAAEQFKSGELNELLKWARQRGEWPLVAKPISGSGSDGVFFCNCEEDLVKAHQEIIGVVNPNGVINTHIALQEFLRGDEYIVDTVSYGGKHLCVSVWVYTKQRGMPWDPRAILPMDSRFLPSSGKVQDLLVDYVFQVLDSVGVRYGPCHTEIMLTPRGPILVEVNQRLHGLQGPHLIGLSTGISKATYAVDALAGGAKLFNELYVPAPDRYLYPLQKECMLLNLVSPVEGCLVNCLKDAVDSMNLPSVIDVLPAVRPGQMLMQSRDLNSLAGQVLLVHESKQQLQDDIARIREAEKSWLYSVHEDVNEERH